MKLPSTHLLVRAVVLALVAVAALVALPGTATAQAADPVAARRSLPTTLTATASPSTVRAGDVVTLSATLTHTVGGAPIAGASVRAWFSTDSGATWTASLSATTDASGHVGATAVPSKTTIYQWRFDGDATYAPATSNNATVTVERLTDLTMSATPTSISAGASTTLSTRLSRSADHALVTGRTVTLWASTNGGSTWSSAGSATTDGTGAASLTKSPTTTTVYQWRYAGEAELAPASSPNATVTVTTRPSALTIGATPATIAPGDSTTLSTTLTRSDDGALVGSRTVTLWASTDGGTTWAAAGSATTDAGGRASLTKSPTASTAYQWRFAGDASLGASTSPNATVTVTRRTSTLTMNATPTSIGAGRSVTLSTTLTRSGGGGLVSPATVTLWASTDGGSTWASAGSATTDAGGSASLTRNPITTTTYQWRYAGDATYDSAISPNATVTVTSRDSALTIDAAPASIAPGASTTLSTRLTRTDDGALVTGRTVTLWASTDAGVTWSPAGEATTDGTGSASLTKSPTATTTYQWRFGGEVGLAPTTSPNATVTVGVRGTTLTIHAAPVSITPGDSTTLSAVLTRTDDHALATGRTLTLWASADGGGTWSPAGSAATDGSGAASLTESPTATTTYQWRFAGDPDLGASSSPTQTVTVVPVSTPTLTEHVSRSRLAVGERLRVKGAYSEPAAGTVVSLYRLRHRGPVLLGTAHLDGRGHYRFRLRPDHRGTWRLRAEVADSTTTTSPVCRVRVH
jgi:hypothetical protein